MTTILIYAGLAILLLLLALLLVQRNREDQTSEWEAMEELTQGLWDESGLRIAERIFDSADFLWLRDEVEFPQLARALARSRQQMALQWLKALRCSFDEMIRSPESLPLEGNSPSALPSWKLLWLTLRIRLLLTYSTVIVKHFGPYHRLIPSLSWVRPILEPGYEKDRYGTADLGNPS